MSIYGNSNVAKVFRCPQCREYMATDQPQCPFCQAPVDAATAHTASVVAEVTNQLYRKAHYKKHLMTGGALLSGGLALVVGSYFLSLAIFDKELFYFSRALILGGGADFGYGVYGLLSEAKST